MPVTNRGRLLTLTASALAVAVLGTLVCIVQIDRTAQLPEGDGSGMQWVILTPLALLFLFVAVPALIVGVRGLRLLRTGGTAERSQALPRRGWLIALGLLVLYVRAPFVVAPILGLFMGE